MANIRQLDGKSIVVMNGSTFDQYTYEFIQNAETEYFVTYAEMALE